MKKISNQRVFMIVMILLTLINLGFVITVFVMHFTVNENGDNKNRHRHFMMEEVGFTDDQMKQFREYRHEFRDETVPLHKKLQQLNRALVMEATSEKPDTTRCYYLSKQIGDVHVELKHLTSLHMMKVREIANPGQVEKLHTLYLEMFDGEFPQAGGRQFRHRGGREN